MQGTTQAHLLEKLHDLLESDGGYLCAWCESVEPDYLQVLPHFHCRTIEVLYLELHHSLAKFVSCKVFVHNKHPGNVFCFGGGQGHTILFLGGPRHK